MSTDRRKRLLFMGAAGMVAVLVIGVRPPGTRPGAPPRLAATSDFSITGDVSALIPGVPGSLQLTVHNPQTVSITVNSLNVAMGAPLPAGCDPANVDLSQASFTGSLVVPAGQTSSVNVPVALLGPAGNGCQNVTFPLIYTGTATEASTGGGGGGGGGGSSGGGSSGSGTAKSIQPHRIAGPDRIDTAVAASEDQFADGTAGAVVLSRSDLYPDALAGTPLAVAKHAPMLLTPPAALDPRTAAEINRVLPAGGTVYVLGAEDAISTAVADSVTSAGYTVVRLGGANRFATAVAIAGAIDSGEPGGEPQAIMLGTGDDPADALAGGAAAAKENGVVLLTDDAVMPPETAAYLAAHPDAPQWALGGPAASADPTASALVGADRYATSVMVAEQFFPKPTALGFADGFAFPDALSGGADIGGQGGPMLLVAPDTLPAVVHDYLNAVDSTVTTADVYGGTDVIPDAELGQIGVALAGL